MSELRWWAVYHRGECVTRVAALSEQAALNVVREYSHLLEIDDEVDEDILAALLEAAPPAGACGRVYVYMVS